MADIELVIKIDEDIAHGIKNGENDEPRNIVRGFQATIADAIKNGKPLEQEPILGKIRAEIMSLERFEIRGEKTPLINGDNVLHIIDKYKAESEASECR